MMKKDILTKGDKVDTKKVPPSNVKSVQRTSPRTDGGGGVGNGGMHKKLFGK